MALNTKEKTTIGRAERVKFPSLAGSVLHARIDTGAKTSSIWATDVKELKEGLQVRFASPEYEIYRHVQIFTTYDRVNVVSSMGHLQSRYRVKIPIVIRGRRIVATFTLADRSTQVYPVLIGRATLAGKFIVDVQKGTPLRAEEAKRSQAIQSISDEEDV